jgi:hypothetical protein
MTNNQGDDEWQAYGKLLQIKGLASPGFAYRVNLARELGLLTPLLAGDWDTVERVASECTESLSAQIRWVYPPPSPELSPRADKQETADSELPLRPHMDPVP